MKRVLRKLCGLRKRDTNLRFLLHGPGGSGKSHVVNVVMKYAKEYCKHLEHPFTKRTIVVTALSGVAATMIGGGTTHSAIALNRSKITTEEKEQWEDTRLVIIDEISLAGPKTHDDIDKNLRELMNQIHEPYGGLNVVFAGDYSQLEPVKVDAIYKDYKDFEDNKCQGFINNLTCFVELNGKWRFIKDQQYGKVMYRFRNGTPTARDIKYIKARYGKVPPAKVRIATSRNKERDSINTAIFDSITSISKPDNGSVLKSAMMIFMDVLQCRNGAGVKVPVEKQRSQTTFLSVLW